MTVTPSDPRDHETLNLQVEGMSCSGCEQRLGTALGRLDGVAEATAEHTSGRVRVQFDPFRTDRGAVVDRVVLAGFAVEDPTSGETGAR